MSLEEGPSIHELPDNYHEVLDRFRSIKMQGEIRFNQGVNWIENIIDNFDHPDRSGLFAGWPQADLQNLLRDILALQL